MGSEHAEHPGDGADSDVDEMEVEAVDADAEGEVDHDHDQDQDHEHDHDHDLTQSQDQLHSPSSSQPTASAAAEPAPGASSGASAGAGTGPRSTGARNPAQTLLVAGGVGIAQLLHFTNVVVLSNDSLESRASGSAVLQRLWDAAPSHVQIVVLEKLASHLPMLPTHGSQAKETLRFMEHACGRIRWVGVSGSHAAMLMRANAYSHIRTNIRTHIRTNILTRSCTHLHALTRSYARL